MLDEEAKLKREIAGLLKQAESQDQSDEDRCGSDDNDGGLPPELKRRTDRLKVIEAAKARLEERARQADKADGRFVDDEGVTRAMCGRRVQRAYGQPDPKDQDNFTDPESRIMPTAARMRGTVIPEPVFGWIKQVVGFRAFSLRGIKAVSAEWHLICTAMNFKRMHRLGWMPG
jgi:hypothetical protein